MTEGEATVDYDRFLTLEEARSRNLLGWNLRCNRCGSYGASWLPNERPGWGDYAACEAHAEEIRAEHRRHKEALRELRAVNFEQTSSP